MPPPHGNSKPDPRQCSSAHAFHWTRHVACAALLGSAVAHTVAQPETANPRRAFGGIQPALSPDGQTIALSFQGALGRMPSHGGTLTRLTREEGWDVEPAWSPDGKQLAYINAPGFSLGTLHLISADQGTAVNLPKEVLARGRVQFDPSGRRLLGMFAALGQPNRLQWLDLETGALTPVPIATIDAIQRASMKWALSRDGATIAFATFQDQPGEQDGNNGPSVDLWRVPSAGGEPRKLGRWPSRIYEMCWDPAGSGFYVVTDRGVAYNDLWYLPVHAPTAKAVKITSGQADEDWPSVSADGQWLVHTENPERATALVRVSLKSGDRQTLVLDRVDFREPTAQLRLVLKDAHTGDPLTARVSVQQDHGKFHFPVGALYRLTEGLGHFYARQQAELTVPAGRFVIRAWRGPEYFVHQEEIELGPGTTRELTVTLDRWINMPEQHWFSGENHIHANYGYGAWHNDPATIRDQCEGEDLHVANVVVANSDGDGVFDRQYFLGRPDPLSAPRTILYWNEEFRSTLWGHLTLGHLNQLVEPIFTGFKDTTNPWDVPTNADIEDRARSQRGTISYTHPASNPDSAYDGPYSAKGLPVDAALGRVDTLDVMGPGYGASLQLWYHLLNCGLHIPGAAGTDVFLNRIASYPPGWGRCYVKLTTSLSYADWMHGQKAGRSFVTTGPMLEWTADAREPGDTLPLLEPGTVRVRARASSQFPMKTLELICDGVVIRTQKATNDAAVLLMEEDVRIEHGGWIAVRCASANNSRHGGATLVAHGNPIYVDIPGRPLDARPDAAYFLAWIDRLDADLKRRNRIPTGLEHVQAQVDTARAFYRRLASAGSQ